MSAFSICLERTSHSILSAASLASCLRLRACLLRATLCLLESVLEPPSWSSSPSSQYSSPPAYIAWYLASASAVSGWYCGTCACEFTCCPGGAAPGGKGGGAGGGTPPPPAAPPRWPPWDSNEDRPLEEGERAPGEEECPMCACDAWCAL